MNDADFGKVLIVLGVILVLVSLVQLDIFLRRRKQREASIEVTHYELATYDELPSGVAVTMAWADATAEDRIEVREKMPVLARNLDRFTKNEL